MKKISQEQIAEAVEFGTAINIPVMDWPGKCHEIAFAIVEAGLVEGDPSYGMYLGPIHKNSMWDRPSFRFGCRHGWIFSKDRKMVIDPTRWVFESLPPYIYRTDDFIDDYDLGAERFTRKCLGKKNFPDPSLGPKIKIPDDPRVRGFIECLLETEEARLDDPGELAMNQLAWIANQPVYVWGNEVLRPVFDWIDKETVGLIPIDARREVLGS